MCCLLIQTQNLCSRLQSILFTIFRSLSTTFSRPKPEHQQLIRNACGVRLSIVSTYYFAVKKKKNEWSTACEILKKCHTCENVCCRVRYHAVWEERDSIRRFSGIHLVCANAIENKTNRMKPKICIFEPILNWRLPYNGYMYHSGIFALKPVYLEMFYIQCVTHVSLLFCINIAEPPGQRNFY